MTTSTAVSSPVPPIAVLVPRLRVGGADAYVRDALQCLPRKAGLCVLVYAIHPSHPEATLAPPAALVHVDPAPLVNERIAFICRDLVARGVRVVLTQLLSLRVLRALWNAEVRTIIIFHNQEPTWSYGPAALDPRHVPFLITSCKSLADSINVSNPRIPIRVIRPLPDDTRIVHSRHVLRRSWNVTEAAFVIGMVGTFKLHKRYTHAIRILHRVREYGVNAYLVIAGGHSETYGGGEQAYHATVGLAERLGVKDFLLCLGEIAEASEILEGIDVFLNTSLYEGLSRATLTASLRGCPVVATDVGGQREAVSHTGHLVASNASATEVAEAVLLCSRVDRPSVDQLAMDSQHTVHLTRRQWRKTWSALNALASGGSNKSNRVGPEAVTTPFPQDEIGCSAVLRPSNPGVRTLATKCGRRVGAPGSTSKSTIQSPN